MEILNNLENKIKNIFGKNQNKKLIFITALGLFGIFLIFLSEIIPEKEFLSENESSILLNEDIALEERLESRLNEEISKIKGAGKTSVMVTFDSSKEYFFAENFSDEKEENQNRAENEIVIIEDENGERPIITKSSEAKIRGVLVICEGGDNAVTREKIIEALCALLDIPSNKVSVASMA